MYSSRMLVTAVWLVLMISTAASTWWFSQPIFSPEAGTLSVMAISAVKAGLVMSDFMELRHAPTPWKIAGTIWIFATAAAVIAIYLLP